MRQVPAWVWALALLPRLALFGYVAARPVRAMVYADTFEYLALARNMALGHRFATRTGALDRGVPVLSDPAAVDVWLQSSVGPPFEVQMFRTPAFPLLAAPWHYLSERPLFPVIPMALLQCLASALLVGLCWRWGGELGGRTGAGFAAAAAALEPATLIHTPLLLTDTLHTACLGLASLLFWRTLKDEDAKPLGALFSGLGYGVAILVRPVSLYLPILLGAFLLRRRRALAAFLLGAYLLPGLWACRNQQQGGQLVVSCVVGDQLPRIAQAMGVPGAVPLSFNGQYYGSAACKAQSSLGSMSGVYLKTILGHPFLFGKMIGWHSFYFLEGTSLDILADMMRGSARPVGSIATRRFQFQREHPVLALAWLAGLALLALLYAAFLRGCWRLAQGGRRIETLFLACSVLYFVAITVPTNWSARYRLPIIPLLAVGAGVGVGRKAEEAAAQAQLPRR